MNPELLEQVRRECAGVYFEATRDCDPNFGITWDEGTKIIYFAEPHAAFSRVGKLFLPKPLKEVATRSSTRSDLANFHIFHYSLNENRVKNQIREMADNERFLWERIKDKSPERRGSITEPFDERTFFAWFKERFSPATVIHGDLWGYSLIVGKRDLNQQVMDHIKQDPINFFNLMRNLSPAIPRIIDSYQQSAQVMHIYDFLKAPKEVHLPLVK